MFEKRFRSYGFVFDFASRRRTKNRRKLIPTSWQPPSLSSCFAIARATVRRFSDEEGMHLAAGIAYYALLSLFPLALLFMTVFSYFIEADQVADWLIEKFGEETPVSLDFLRETLRSAGSWRGPIGALSLVGTVLSSTLVFAAIMRSINRAWGFIGTGKRNFLRRKLWELAILVALAVAFLLAFAAASVFEVLKERPIFGYCLATDNYLWTMFLNLVTVVGLMVIMLLLYKYVPGTHVRWRHVILPAFLASLGFRLANSLLTWHISRLGYYDAVYGSVSTIIVFLLWLYLFANILIVGATLSAVLSSRARQPAGQDGTPIA